MKYIAITIIVLFIVWLAAVKMQENQRVPVAQELIRQKMTELKSAGFYKLSEKTGKGSERQNIVKDGVTYYLSFTVQRSANTDKELKVIGRVDCITLLPFWNLRTGPTFELTVARD
jgi:hypothetical protein